MSRPLRICFVAYRGNMQCGGQGVYLWHLVRGLAELGHEVTVLVGPPYPDAMPFAREVRPLPNDHYWGHWFTRDWSSLAATRRPFSLLSPLRFFELAASRIGFFVEPFVFSVRAFRELAGLLRAGRRFDVVHDVQCLGWGLLAIRALGLPVVTTVHHPLTVDRRTSFRRDRTLIDAIGTVEFHPVEMQGFVARRLDRVITSSEASAGLIRADFGVDPARIRMLGNGLDTDRFRPDPSVPRAAGELLCVGRAADPNKGIEVLVRALAQLPDGVRLTLVDRDYPRHEARKLAAALGIEHRLRVTGPLPLDELVRCYRRATAVVVPSLFEGFGLPAVEAMACGTPVVASAAGALREVVATGAGVLVPPGDPDALTKVLAALLEQDAARERLGREARQRVVDAYAWPRIAERTEAVYRELLEARGRPASTTTSAQSGRLRAS